LNWYKTFSTAERTTFHSAFLGWVLDAFDFMVFTFVVTSLITLWGVSKGEIGLLSTVSLLCSAIGGWVAGVLADRFGRVRILKYIILWFSLFTFLIGFAQNMEQLFVLRALQGFGFGGEWAVGAVLIGEIVRPEHRGKTVGAVQSGWAVGWGLAALLYTVAFSLLPEGLAWRSMFWIGLLPAFFVFYIRACRRTRKLQACAASYKGRGRTSFVPAHFLAAHVVHHGVLLADVRRTPGRLLRHRDLDPHLPSHGKAFVGDRHGELPRGSHHGFVHRLCRRRLHLGSDRPARQHAAVRDLVGPVHDRLHEA
jgi:MFS family permease